MDLDARNMPWLSLEAGLPPEQTIAMQHFADEHDVILMVRDLNPASQLWYGEPGMQPKPQTLKAKTALIGPDAGLVVDPYHPRQQAAWEVAVAGDPSLRADWERAQSTWDKYEAEMHAAGYRVDEATGRVYLPEYNATGASTGRVAVEAFHGDIDLAAVLIPDGQGGYQRVNFGSGGDAVNQWEDVYRMQLNNELSDSIELENSMATAFRDALSGTEMEGMLPSQTYTPTQREVAAGKEFIQHGAAADWVVGSPYPGEVVVFVPGTDTPLHFKTEAELRQFYNDRGLPWPYGPAHFDHREKSFIFAAGKLSRAARNNMIRAIF